MGTPAVVVALWAVGLLYEHLVDCGIQVEGPCISNLVMRMPQGQGRLVLCCMVWAGGAGRCSAVTWLSLIHCTVHLVIKMMFLILHEHSSLFVCYSWLF